MAYKKYIKRDGKSFGPYVYHSRKVKGKVITEYRGKHKKNPVDFLVLALVPIFLVFSFGLILISNPHYAEGVKDVLFGSVSSITGFVTEEILIPEIPGGSVEETLPIEEIIQENASEEIRQEEILPETPLGEFPTETLNETEIVQETNETFPKKMIENQTKTVPELTEEVPIINETKIIINETVEILNEISPANITMQNITNETIINKTTTNLSLENITVNTLQFQAILNQKVKWRKTISSEEIGNLTITIPENSEKIAIKKIKENREEDITGRSAITGAVVGSSNINLWERISRLFKVTGRVG